jgi:hypothetical protein
MNSVRTSFLGCGLALTLFGNVTGCSSAEPDAVRDELAQSAGVAPSACVEIFGNAHCSLGNARLRATGDALTVSNLSTSGKDGVAISLPEAVSYIPTGTYANSAATSTVNVSAISDGVTTSTVKAVNVDGKTSYVATFTGSGQSTTYSAIFSRNGEEVARVSRIPSGQVTPALAARPRIWRWIKFHVRIVPAYVTAAAAGDVSGACSWEQDFDPNEPAMVTLADGQTIEVDNLELREDVAVGGSYPYTSFDRIDYTANGGTFTLTGEEIR